VSADLTTYAGRARRRPPGASDFTQRLYRLLHEHPDGMTRAEIHEALREGWMETDAYRAYTNYLRTHRKVYEQGTSAPRVRPSGRPSAEPGTPEFKAAAQRWWISAKLGTMKGNGSVRREGTGTDARWFATRPPRVRGQKSTYVPFDPDQSRAVLTATSAENVRAENAKAELLALLNDKRIRGRTRDGIQAAYDYLCGRR
jgi:hypothetical protein